MSIDVTYILDDNFELLFFLPSITYGYLFISENNHLFLWFGILMSVTAPVFIINHYYEGMKLENVNRLFEFIQDSSTLLIIMGFLASPIFLISTVSLSSRAITVEEVAFTTLFLGNISVIVGGVFSFFMWDNQ